MKIRATWTLHTCYKQPQNLKARWIKFISKNLCTKRRQSNSYIHRAKDQQTRVIYNTDRSSDFFLLRYVQFELISTVTVYHDMWYINNKTILITPVIYDYKVSSLKKGALVQCVEIHFLFCTKALEMLRQMWPNCGLWEARGSLETSIWLLEKWSTPFYGWIKYKKCAVWTVRPIPSNPCLPAFPDIWKFSSTILTFSKFGHSCSKDFYTLQGIVALPHLSYILHLGDSNESSTGLEYTLHLAARAENNWQFRRSKGMMKKFWKNDKSFNWHALKHVISFWGYKNSGTPTSNTWEILSFVLHNSSKARYTV
jgi:hypothetical protein